MTGFSAMASGESVLSELADAEDKPGLVQQHRFLGSRRFLYMALCFSVTVSFSALSIGLWSDMGCQTRCLDVLQSHGRLRNLCSCVVLATTLVLYLLDFFAPAHIQGRYCALRAETDYFGRGCFALVFCAAVAWCYLSSKGYPTLPLVITNLLCPLAVVLLRRITMPLVPEKPETYAGIRGLEDRIALIKLLTWEERDEKNFYTAAMYGFAGAGALCFATFVPWALANEQTFTDQIAVTTSQTERELLFVRWGAPLYIGISNLVFAGFALLRVTQNGAYSATDKIKNQLLYDLRNSDRSHMMQYRIAMLRARVAAANNQQDLFRTTQDQLQKYLVQHISHMRRLSKIVKSVACTIVAMILALHIVFQMTNGVRHVAIVVEGVLATYLFVFMVFIFVSFNRVSRSMSLELMDLPLMKTLTSCLQTDIARAVGVCLCLPFVPLILATSAFNQCVRKLRGINQTDGVLTGRVEEALAAMMAWDWVKVLGWSYLAAAVFVVFRLAPIFLNVLLAWMSLIMAPMSYPMVCAATFLTGVGLFMLPPVPGPIIYPFAGIVMSDPVKCPYGFWGGSLIGVILSFLMKISASVVQQKVFGEQLGNSLSVRRLVGIHKPSIRAIENILKTPGLGFGKCMILCGGPDWPTSVLAGILRLSVVQCQVGTTPILATVVPMALTGSVYLKRDESEVWLRTGNLLLFSATVVAGAFWLGIGWAIQTEFDLHGREINRRRKEDVDLHWLDHVEEEISQRTRVEWKQIPGCVRRLYLLGAVIVALTGHMFVWTTSVCFGTFQVTDDIQSLRWLGEGGLIKPLGFIGFLVMSMSFIPGIIFSIWCAGYTRGAVSAVRKELAEQEQAWKLRWLKDVALEDPSRQSISSASLALADLQRAPTLLSMRSGALDDMIDACDGSPKSSRPSATPRKRRQRAVDEEVSPPNQDEGDPEHDARSDCGGLALGSAARTATVGEVVVDLDGLKALPHEVSVVIAL